MGWFNFNKKQKKTPEKPLALSEEWEFYQCYINNQPFSIRFETAIENLTESMKKRYPHIIELTVPFIESNENGFPTRSELQRMNKIEDNFSSGSYNVCLIGVITGGNCSRFVFCCDGTEEDIENVIQTLMGVNKNISYSEKVFMYNNFEYFKDVLAPSVFEKNWIINRHICDNLKKNGETFSIPRNIDFRCYFASTRHIQDVVGKLCAQGFVEHDQGKADNGDYWLDLTLKGIPSHDWMNEITNEILDVLDDTDGYFDGWGCVVVKD